MTIEISESMYVPEAGGDISIGAEINFNPKKYKRQADAAKALYKAICELAKTWGQNPEIEVMIQTPEESERGGYGRNWRVCWEAGPFQWAIQASFQVENMPYWYTEPHYSFDLCFTQ